jgi:SAM-dependent methyltransferase
LLPLRDGGDQPDITIAGSWKTAKLRARDIIYAGQDTTFYCGCQYGTHTSTGGAEITDAMLNACNYDPDDEHYEDRAEVFWEGTRDHDVSQNIDALLNAVTAEAPFQILDFGCGPGRDLLDFEKRGHAPTGVDGCEAFVHMARDFAGVPVLHQDFLALDLPDSIFDGIFANASLFRVPTQSLARVLSELRACLKPGGVLFASNPRGENQEGWNGERYCVHHDLKAWQGWLTRAGFEEIEHYYRPRGLPREQQPWLDSLWRRPSA